MGERSLWPESSAKRKVAQDYVGAVDKGQVTESFGSCWKFEFHILSDLVNPGRPLLSSLWI